MSFTRLLIESLVSWEFVERAGTVIVICGCWGEYVADFGRGISKCEPIKDRLAKRSTIILIVGLAIELFGLVKTSQQSSETVEALRSDNATLHERASKLEKEAADSRFKAASLEASLEAIKSIALDTQDKLNSLQSSNGVAISPNFPRHITDEQSARFLELSKNIPKGYVDFSIATQSPDADAFFEQLKKLLIQAGYDANHPVAERQSGGPEPVGLLLPISEAKTNTISMETGLLLNCLQASKIRVGLYRTPLRYGFPDSPQNATHLIIGAPPM